MSDLGEDDHLMLEKLRMLMADSEFPSLMIFAETDDPLPSDFRYPTAHVPAGCRMLEPTGCVASHDDGAGCLMHKPTDDPSVRHTLATYALADYYDADAWRPHLDELRDAGLRSVRVEVLYARRPH